MKFSHFIFILTFLCGAFAQADIKNSDLDERHQTLIENEIFSSCGLSGDLAQEFLVIREIVVDQGVRDFEYQMELSMKVPTDQNQFDLYRVSVRSMEYSIYDHENQEWGVYSVEEVLCDEI